MQTFNISEVQDVNSTRQGEVVQVENIDKAKKAACKMQCYQGTVMKIEDNNGNVICYRKGHGKWVYSH